ncbi:MAG TPA: hypothetical protein VLU41_05775, partial [Ideonella sp.]|nr:hypothetical protein [Ideonella sp.]
MSSVASILKAAARPRARGERGSAWREAALDMLIGGWGDVPAAVQRLARLAPDDAATRLLQAAVETLQPQPTSREAVRRWLDGVAPTPLGDALLAWAHGDEDAAADAADAAARSDPHDRLALFIAHRFDFAVGHGERMRDRLDAALRAWPRRRRGRAGLVALHAFALADAGDAADSARAARRGPVHDGRSPRAVHAVVHALHARGDIAGVVGWLARRAAHWLHRGAVATHLWWHLAVAKLALGDVPAARALLADELLPHAAASPSALGDASDLVGRLGVLPAPLAGVASRLSDLWARRWLGDATALQLLLAGLCHVRAGQPARVAATLA